MDNTLFFDEVFERLYSFFKEEEGFVFVPSQSRLSILAACEDPRTLASTNICGKSWPLPQTGQMNLEVEILKHPNFKGVFCYTTSYRDEPNPIPGRHDIVFPMIEFESFGDLSDLEKVERKLLKFLDFDSPKKVSYEEACRRYCVNSIEADQEKALCGDNNGSVMLHTFPMRTHPFWNMKHNGRGLYSKIDVLLGGMETIGSAERSCNIREMRENFLAISNGKYAESLFGQFGKQRVMSELDTYLALDMVPRYGAGIGVTRLIRAMELNGLLKENNLVRC